VTADDSSEISALTERATTFLGEQPWCSRIVSMTPIFSRARILAVFRASLIPRQPGADVMVWVVVGDVPPATITHEPGDGWQDALAGYVKEMRRWANADKPSPRLEWIENELVDVDPRSVKNDI
jgi:hypothetical protein